jgi:ArsR family metal-binding transcriptional regulator
MDKVWVVKNNGQHHEEVFPNTQDAINYAKQSSLRAMCSIRNQGKVAIVYEQGEVADARRTKELTEAVVEILEHQNERFAKEGRGKASRRKV